jgi:hypothetical protein
MVRKESLKSLDKLEGALTDLSTPKSAGRWGRILEIIKFILGAGLLPLAYSVSVAFAAEFSKIDKALQAYFWAGAVAFTAIYLFIWEPVALYNKGQKMTAFIFSFFKPLVKAAPAVLPVYTLFIFILYGVLGYFSKGLVNYFLFLFGFSITLHLIFSAKVLRAKEGGFLKGNYIFGFSFVYVMNLALAVFCLNLIFAQISFVTFCNNSYQLASGIIYAVFKQLFRV